MSDTESLMAERLEQHMIEQLPVVSRERVKVLLSSVDKLLDTPLLPHQPERLVGRVSDPPALIQFARDLVTWTRRALQDLIPADRSVVEGLLESRGVTIGPRGRDAANRSTYALCTPKGRFILE